VRTIAFILLAGLATAAGCDRDESASPRSLSRIALQAPPLAFSD